jgi:hypothetical protein
MAKYEKLIDHNISLDYIVFGHSSQGVAQLARNQVL